MNTAYTIVVPDNEILSRLCGANDSNLKLIEQHLGISVYTKGNELSVDNDDPAIQQQFRFIVDRIIDEIEDGCSNSADALSAILNTDRHASFDESSILVPGAIRKVYPKTQNQADYIRLLRKNDMVFCTGPAGSGKTFLAVAEALRLVLSREKSGIVLTRPVVEAGENLGYLPGDLDQKISPYLKPLYDAMETVIPRDMVRKLVENGIVETAPLAYMRGRTINNSVIILDEAQNTTCEQMKMFLTRMGSGSKVFVTGDITQVDLPKRVNSGLVHAVSLLQKISEIGIFKMTTEDVVRSSLVRKIVQAYENE